MINLLPPEAKKQIRAARMNVILVNYCVLIVFTATVLAGVYAVGFWANMNDQQVASNAKTTADQTAQQYADTRKQAEDFAKDLTVAKTILASNVSFSEFVLNIAGVVPSGVILSSLSLGGTTKADAPITLNGRAVSYDAAIALKNSLDASPIFEGVNIVNISQTDLSTLTGQNASPEMLKYPFVINLSAKFSTGTTGGKQ